MGVFGLGRPSLMGGGPMPAFGPGAPTSAMGVQRRLQEAPGEEPNEGVPWWKPLLPVLLSGGLAVAQQVWQNRREDSAHQREMRDLESAGLNPMLAAAGQGAQTGNTDVIGSALALNRARAEIELVRSQAMAARGSAAQSEASADEIKRFAPGRAAEVAARTAVAQGNVKMIRAQLPFIRKRAEAEIRQMMASGTSALSSADLNRVLSELRGTELANAKNVEALATRLGIMSPMLQLLIQMMNTAARF